MKIIIPFAVAFLTATSVLAVPSDDPVLDARLHVAALQGSGFGPQHPELREAQARVDALAATTPAVPSADYLSHIQNRLKEAEQEDIVLGKEGFTDKHPKRMIVVAQIKFLQQELQRSQR